MTTYIVRRLLQSIVVLIGVTLLVYILLFQTGDPVFLSVGTDATQADVEAARKALGYDRPFYVQYAEFLWGVVRGDLGDSLRQNQPVVKLFFDRLPATIELTFAALLISLVVAIPAGIIAATRRNSLLDNGAMFGAMLGQSAPVFFVGIVLLWFFGGQLGWFPIGGRGQGGFVDHLRHLILPAVTLSVISMSRNTRLMRSNLLEVLRQDYVRTAWAKGLRERSVVIRHALKNSLIPVVTVIGLDFGALIGGAVVTETVFAWPGVGSLVVRAIGQKDFPVVVGSVTLLSFLFVLVNLVVDLVYGFLDPRIRFS